jgi:cation diffusion facilitator family transporter
MMDRAKEIKLAEKGALLSIFAYVILSTLKLFVAYKGDSEALKADGLNNVTDVVSSIAVLIGLKISRKPPDEDHLYGHSRAEYISSMIASFIMAAVGIQIIYEAGLDIYISKKTYPDMLTAWTALFCAAVMYFVYRYNRKLAKALSSSALTAAAQDNKSDALVSVGTFIGIIGSKMSIYWLDTFTAIIVGMIICKTAFDIFKETSLTLTDGFKIEKLEPIRKTIEATKGVIKVTDLKARTFGNKTFVETTVVVDPYLNVIESHHISEEIEKNTIKEHKNTIVHVHVEPY